MPARDPVADVVREWVIKAENDLKTAVQTLKLGSKCPTDTVAFHAQQCAEKYLKALLVLRSTAFPRIHDLEALVRLTPSGVLANWPLEEQRRLTAYATLTRCPGDYEPISSSEARQAVRIARRVRKEIRALLPAKVLRRRRK